jgi:Flp pilus assembly protein TadG
MTLRIKEKQARGKASGQSLVELVLIVPLLLITLYIPIDFGIAFVMAHLAQNAVREGARIGSGVVSGDPDRPVQTSQGTTIKDAVFGRLPSRLLNPSVTVKFYFTSATATCLQVVEVTARGNYEYGWYRLLRLIGIITVDTAPISVTTQMRYNYQSAENNLPICGGTGFERDYSS